jgi:hypothetical protein
MNSMCARFAPCVAILAAMFLVPVGTARVVRADLVYENPFSEVSTTNSTVSGNNYFATGFTTGTAGAPLTLTSIDLALATSGTVSSSNPIVQIFSGVASPTTLIDTLTGGALTSATPVKSAFTPSAGTLNLQPLTNYWIVVSAAVGDAFGFYATDSNPTAQNGSGYSFAGGLKSTNGGTSYTGSLIAGTSYVGVHAVPEPSTCALAAIGAGAAAWMIRRRRTAKTA